MRTIRIIERTILPPRIEPVNNDMQGQSQKPCVYKYFARLLRSSAWHWSCEMALCRPGNSTPAHVLNESTGLGICVHSLKLTLSLLETGEKIITTVTVNTLFLVTSFTHTVQLGFFHCCVRSEFSWSTRWALQCPIWPLHSGHTVYFTFLPTLPALPENSYGLNFPTYSDMAFCFPDTVPRSQQRFHYNCLQGLSLLINPNPSSIAWVLVWIPPARTITNLLSSVSAALSSSISSAKFFSQIP